MPAIKNNQESVRWGIMGLGRQAERVAAAFAETTGADLSAVASDDHERARAFAERFGVPAVAESIDELIRRDDIEAIYLATPNHRHSMEAQTALRAGKHVLVEKPMALTRQEADEMRRAAAAAGRYLGVGFHLRHRSTIQEARRIVQDGTLGVIRRIQMEWSIGTPGETTLPPLPAHQRWREDPALSGGGALMARGVHLFDVIRFVTGQEILETTGMTDPHPDTGVDITAVALLRLVAGYAVVETSRTVPFAANEIRISGSLGRFTIRGALAPGTEESIEIETAAGARHLHFPGTNAWARQLEDFAAAVRGESHFGATADDGYRTTCITEDFLTAARNNRRVAIHYAE